MAFTFDPFGAVIDLGETEEERKKREEEVARETTIKTYGDGSIEKTTTEQLPAEAVQPVAPEPAAVAEQAMPAESAQAPAVAYTSPVLNPEIQTTELPALAEPAAAGTRSLAQAAAAKMKVNPVTPDKFTAQQESGGNYNIGYHYQPNEAGQRKSSAFGAYGITAPAYQDIQRADPYFANRPITSLTPEEQDRAQGVLKGQYARQLQAQGVEPTEENLRGAHLMGAKGLANYLKTGQVSPQAAAANGGEAKLKQILAQRMAGAPSPASGATQAPPVAPIAPGQEPAPAPVTGQAQAAAPGAPITATPPAPATPTQAAISAYQAGQDDPMALLKLSQDETTPAWMKERARSRAGEILNQSLEKQKAEKQATTLIEATLAGDPKASRTLGSELSSKAPSFLKMILAGFVSPQLAGEYAKDLGFGSKWSTGTDANGNTAMIEYDGRGKPVSGVKADGTPLKEDEIMAYASGGTGKWATSAEFFQDKAGNVYQAQHNDKGQTRMVDTKTGARYSGSDPLNRLRDVAGQQKMTQQQEFRRENMKTTLGNQLTAMKAKDRLGVFSDYNKALIAEGLPTLTMSDMGLNADGSLASERAAGATAPAPVAPIAPPTTAGAAAAPVAPIAPSGAAGGAPVPAVAPAGGPVAPGPAPAVATAPGARPTLAEIEKRKAEEKKALELEAAQGKANIQVTETEQKNFLKYSDEDITPKADAGSSVSRIRKEQISGPDGILRNPEMAGILQGGKGSEVANIIRDVVTGNFKDQADLTSRVEALRLDDRQKNLLYRQINLAASVNPYTLKANAGAGSVSDAEQKANKAANIDPLRQPLYAGITDLSRSQFVNDTSVARAAYKAAHPELKTTDAFNSSWSKEKDKVQKQYDQIFEARAQYIAKYNPNGQNPGAVVDAFKHYPTPEWNAQTNTWNLGTDFARKAARPKLSDFNR